MKQGVGFTYLNALLVPEYVESAQGRALRHNYEGIEDPSEPVVPLRITRDNPKFHCASMYDGFDEKSRADYKEIGGGKQIE